MLTAAVGLTLIGFVLLVVALMQANFALAVACIAVCVVGLLVLLYDTIRANRRGRAGVADEPLFTIRGRESASREEPLIDDDAAADAAQVDQNAGTPTGHTPTAGTPTGGWTAQDPTTQAYSAGMQPTGAMNNDPVQPDAPATQGYWESPSTSGLGSVVSPDAHGNAVSGAQAQETPTGETGDANDYIRSVTGSFPAQTGPSPVAGTDYTTGVPSQAPPESQAPPAPSAPDSGARGFTAPNTAARGPLDTGSFQSASAGGEGGDPSGYVGRRRRIEQSENVVVNTSDPTLPAMQFVYRDSDDEVTGDKRSESPSADDDK